MSLDLFGHPLQKVLPPPHEGLADLAKTRGDSLHLGTSSWSFPGWKNKIYAHTYSEGLLAKEGLRAYAQHPLLNAVGIDRAHYAPLSVAEFEKYREAVPEGFKFLVKTHDHLTLARFPSHARYGALKNQKNPTFLDVGHALDFAVGPAIEGLKDTLGTLLFQFAPQDVTLMGGPQGFAEKLHRFLQALPQLPEGACYSVEVRNAELLTEDYRQALIDTRTSHCVNAISTMPSVREQIEFARDAIGPMFIGRWMLRRQYSYAEAFERYAPFSNIVDADVVTRKQYVHALLHAGRTGRRSILIVNNKAEGCAPESLLEVARELARAKGESPDSGTLTP